MQVRVKSVKILMKMPKKEVEIMKELKMLEILNQIEVCIERNSLHSKRFDSVRNRKFKRNYTKEL